MNYSMNMDENIIIKPFFKTKDLEIYVVDIPGRSTIYYAETLERAKDYVRGYKKETAKKRTTSYNIGLRDRLRDDMLFGDITA